MDAGAYSHAVDDHTQVSWIALRGESRSAHFDCQVVFEAIASRYEKGVVVGGRLGLERELLASCADGDIRSRARRAKAHSSQGQVDWFAAYAGKADRARGATPAVVKGLVVLFGVEARNVGVVTWPADVHSVGGFLLVGERPKENGQRKGGVDTRLAKCAPDR